MLVAHANLSNNPTSWPAGFPDSTPLYFQYAVKDPLALNGVALSNAVVGLTP
jgi:hypothetical protein